jgi:cell fate (sporulation/competence/biofilm development) regulator YlbF (YheA/YmcA/DUF963 family)
MDQIKTQPNVLIDGQNLDIEQSVREFAMALTEADVFQDFEVASHNLRQDQEAQGAIRAFQEKQNSLQMMLMLNAAPPDDQQELERLRDAFVSNPTVAAYMEAQENLTNACQAVAQILNESTGLNFSTACGPGCC